MSRHNLCHFSQVWANELISFVRLTLWKISYFGIAVEGWKQGRIRWNIVGGQDVDC